MTSRAPVRVPSILRSVVPQPLDAGYFARTADYIEHLKLKNRRGKRRQD
ncbi:MAG: hypothetical protein LBI10_06235 [Deltaproteobacteria bacterium]|nr:hypothetical protein [Deltaproteobacteria bacterium]